MTTNQPGTREPWDETGALAAGALRALAGVRVGLIGFEPDEAARLVSTLEQVQAFVRVVATSDVQPGSFLLARLDLLLLALSPGLESTPWRLERIVADNDRPLVLVGSPAEVLTARAELDGQVRDFLTVPVRHDELLVRAGRALERAAIVVDPAPVERPVAPPTTPAQRAADTTTPRVIVADDDATVVALVSTTLRNYGIECHAAANGQEALEMARDLQPDAIVLDLNMPQLDGFAVLAALRNERATRDVAVVILSARQQEADILRGFGLGADDYVVKPFNPMELAVRLKRMIRGRRCEAA